VVWILLAIFVACFVAYAVWRLFLGYPRPRRGYRLVAPREVAFLDAAAEASFPSGGVIPLSGRDADLPGYADSFLLSLPGHLRLQVRAMLMLFEQATIFFPAPGRGGRRRFSSLDESQRVAALQGWSSSRFFLRRLAFTALRAVLTMGYLGHPIVMRHLRLAPLDFPSPVCEADLLYPAVGKGPETIRLTRADLWESDGTPLDLEGPVHPDYAGDHRPGEGVS
jgi:hypothetical protein